MGSRGDDSVDVEPPVPARAVDAQTSAVREAPPDEEGETENSWFNAGAVAVGGAAAAKDKGGVRNRRRHLKSRSQEDLAGRAMGPVWG